MALPRRRRQRPRHITASAYRVGDGDEDYQKRQAMEWQDRALEYVRIVPEINFASRFYPRMLKQLRIYPATMDEQGHKKEIKSGPPVEQLNRVSDPGGGKTQILGNYGRLMFATGEGLLFGRNLNTERERWSFIWNNEVKIETDPKGRPTKFTHLVGNGQERVYTPQQAVTYRMWTPDPGNSFRAESPMQASLQIAEELIALGKGVMATAVTRLTNPLLFMPLEILPPVAEPIGDEDPYNDPWASEFLDHIRTEIEHPETAEGRAPLISWVAGEHIEKIKTIKLHDPASDYAEKELRTEAIRRLSYGLDMPPEALTGLGNTNHWAAMQILGDMWKSHGAPLAEQFCDEMTAVYLQPALRDMDFPGWESVVVAYDESQVVVRPDRSDVALDALKEGAVGPSGFRKLANIPDEYAPTPKEMEMMLEWHGRGEKPEPQPQPMLQEQNGNGRDPSVDGPPRPGPEGDSGRRTRVVTSAAYAHEAMGAAMMSLARCRELAGIRLWQKQKNCPDCFMKADGQPHALVASILGADVVKQVGWDPVRLVRGGTDTLRDMLVYWDYSPKQADAICEMIESFAAHTLFNERLPQLPAGFATHLERAKEMDYAVE